MWLQKKTADGKWEYGYGEYKKSLIDVGKTQPVYKTIMSGLPTEISSLVNAGITFIQGVGAVTDIDNYTKLPTYYIWARKVGDVKRIGGEWNMFTGGAEAMKTYFNNAFEQCFAHSQADLGRVMCVNSSLAGPAAVKGWRLAQAAGGSTGGAIPAADENGGGGGSIMLPLLIVGGVVLLALLKR